MHFSAFIAIVISNINTGTNAGHPPNVCKIGMASYNPGLRNSLEAIPDLRTRDAIRGYLRGLAQQLGVKEEDEWLARELDRRDQLAHLRTSFHIPTIGDLLDEKERDAGKAGGTAQCGKIKCVMK